MIKMNIKKKKKSSEKISEEAIKEYTETGKEVNSDPDGSWTGCPERKYEKPVQDADDL